MKDKNYDFEKEYAGTLPTALCVWWLLFDSVASFQYFCSIVNEVLEKKEEVKLAARNRAYFALVRLNW